MNRREFFGNAYERGLGRTQVFLCQHGLRTELAREHAQAGWAKTWLSFCTGRIRDERRLLQFANTAALNSYRDDLTRNRRLTDLSSAAAATNFSPCGDDRMIDVRKALGKIGNRQRELLETVYLREGWTATELASSHESVGALHHRLSRARRALQKAMAIA